MQYTVDGLVIRSRDYGENDRLLTVLTKDGKITVIAKGARSMKSKFRNLTEPFVYANFELSQRDKGIPWIRGGSANEIFYGLRESIEKLFLASYICDVANELSGERVDCTPMLRLVLNTLYAMMNDIRPLQQIKGVFEIRAAAFSGYMPDLSHCEECGVSNAQSAYFDLMNGAFICSACLQKRGEILKKDPSLIYDDIRERSVIIPINETTLAASRYAISSPSEKMLSFSISDSEDLKGFSKICEEYLLHHLGHGFDSLDLYYSII